MMTLFKPLAVAAVMPLAFIGCTSTNPSGAFNEVQRNIASRSGHEVRWPRDEHQSEEVEHAIHTMLQTNLTVESAVAIALLNNRALQAGFEDIGVSQAELAQASRLRNPQFEGFWRVPTHAVSTVNAEYALAQDFLDLLTLPARKKIAARNVGATKLRIADEILAVKRDVHAAFYAVQAGQQLTNRLAIVLEVNEAAADVAKRQFDAGNITDLDLVTQQAAYSQARLDYGRALTQLTADRERLNRLLSLWGAQTAWTAAPELPSLPPKEPSLENLEALAVSQRFDLAAARSDVLAVQSALKLKKSVRWVPAASVGVSAEHDLDHSWVIGPTLALEVPIFDQGQAEVARLGSEYRRASRKFESLAINVRSEVRQARDAMIAARNTAEYYQKVLLPQRQRILRETLLQYNAMQLGAITLLNAKEREALTEREAVDALREYWTARAELERAVGGRLDGQPKAAESSAQKPTESHEHKH